jgi:DNA-binding XRE family transcriptional regulator
VVFPDCPGCQTQADSADHVADVAAEALAGWLETHLQMGEVPPHPGTRVRALRGGRTLWVDVPVKLAVKLSLRWARQDARLTQAQLARRAGVTQPAIAQLEDPDSNPTIDTLDKVARALGVQLRVTLESDSRAA